MNLKGIKANFLGDSITEGHGVTDTEHNIYWQRLGEACGLAEYRGYGISGTRIAIQHTVSDEPRWDLNFISRVAEMDPDAIRRVTEFYGIPVLDLYATSGLQPQVDIIMQRFCPDGLHPNDAGQEKIYKRLRGFLESL